MPTEFVLSPEDRAAVIEAIASALVEAYRANQQQAQDAEPADHEPLAAAA